jgi:hypothetical protein
MNMSSTLWTSRFIAIALLVACNSSGSSGGGASSDHSMGTTGGAGATTTSGGDGGGTTTNGSGGMHSNMGAGGSGGHATAGHDAGGAGGSHSGGTGGSDAGSSSGTGGKASDEHDAGSEQHCPPECLRAYTCARSCDEPAMNNGCCPCPAGTIDTITCNTSSGFCGLPCMGAKPDDAVVAKCQTFTDEASCSAWHGTGFPDHCEWHTPATPPCLVP